ncbi:MAG: putative PEP-binding protein [Leptolyngbyaceae cyanobacterium]
MTPFLSLNQLIDVDPSQTGETAAYLCQLQQAGQRVPPTWVISPTCFHQALQQLTSRDPIYSDWPRLLWQHQAETGYSVQHLAKRLSGPLSRLPLPMDCSTLVEQFQLPVLRLLPSIWLSNGAAAAPWSQMLPSPFCWADSEALAIAVKQIWLAAVDASSLTYWGHWLTAPTTGEPPARVELAIVVQAVEAVTCSGTMTVRPSEVAIAAVDGLAQAMSEAYPTIGKSLPETPSFHWQPGYQEQRYRHHALKDDPAKDILAACLIGESRDSTDLTLSTAAQQALQTFAQWLTAWASQPLHIDWGLDTDSQLHIIRADRWPLHPWVVQPVPQDAQAGDLIYQGAGAAPGRCQGRALVLSAHQPLPQAAELHIIIAQEVMPAWLPLLKTARGIISERGGLTSHAAVMARELGIPAIVGVANATQQFQPGEALELDGDRGLVTRLPEITDLATATPHWPTGPLATTRTEIWVNLSQPDLATAISHLSVAGVGILRSEWLMMPVLEQQHPYYWLTSGRGDQLLAALVKLLRPILSAFAPRPVRYRTLDIRTSEFADLEGAPPVESNPMLGVRGAYSYYHHPEFFDLELRLLKQLQDEGLTNIQLLLPFVRTVEEVSDCRALVEATGLGRHPDFALWMMAEVPSVLFMLPQYAAAGIRGIAIGAHDLTQLLLGVDRDQAVFTDPYNETHPAVLAAVSQLIQVAQRENIDCCLCGAFPSRYPDLVEAAVRQKIMGLSVDASALQITAQIVQHAEAQGH